MELAIMQSNHRTIDMTYVQMKLHVIKRTKNVQKNSVAMYNFTKTNDEVTRDPRTNDH